MTTKEWLSRGWKLNETINKKLEAQYKAYNLACSATAHGSDDRVQTGHKNTTEDILVRYIDLSREVDKLTDELYDIKRETWQAINRVDNKLYKKILKLRFVYFKSWGYIATHINKPVSSTKQYYLEKAIINFSQYIV